MVPAKERKKERDRYNHTSTCCCCCCYFISGLASYLLLLFFHFVIQRRRRQQQTSICSRKRLWHLSLSLSLSFVAFCVLHFMWAEREREVSRLNGNQQTADGSFFMAVLSKAHIFLPYFPPSLLLVAQPILLTRLYVFSVWSNLTLTQSVQQQQQQRQQRPTQTLLAN